MFARPVAGGRGRILFVATLVALLTGVAVAFAALGGAEKPPARSLPSALHRAVLAPPVAGVTARIRFTNRLVGTGTLPRAAGSSPLLTGATGRAWVAGDGRFRLELQGAEGDVQVVGTPRMLALYDGRANRLTTLRLPRAPRSRERDEAGGPPSLAAIRRGLRRLSRHLVLSGAVPSVVAGRPAYAATLAPRRHGGLLASLTAAWDADRGVPLRLAVTAKGSRSPVLELAATQISYGAIPAARFALPSPAGVRRERLAPPRERRGERRPARSGERAVTGVAAVSRAAGFSVAAPARLAGRPRTEVRLAGRGRDAAAVVLYGEGLDGLAVLQTRAAGPGARELRGLPAADLGPVTGRQLPTALGTLVRWRAGGITTVLAGSVEPGTALAAARTLVRR